MTCRKSAKGARGVISGISETRPGYMQKDFWTRVKRRIPRGMMDMITSRGISCVEIQRGSYGSSWGEVHVKGAIGVSTRTPHEVCSQ